MEKKLVIFGVILMFLSFFIDKKIISFIVKIRNVFLNEVMIIVSSLIFMAIVFALYCYLLRKKKENVLDLFFLVMIAYILANILKLIFMRERPLDGLLVDEDYSFPSAHTSVIFSMFFLMLKEFPKKYFLFLVIAVVIAFSRLYLGMHYLADVIGGVLLGYFVCKGYFYLKGKWK